MELILYISKSTHFVVDVLYSEVYFSRHRCKDDAIMENARNRTKRPIPKEKIIALMYVAFFLFAAALSCATTYHTSGNMLDGDASGELVLSQHLSETGQVLSSDWYYSTELRFLNTQLIYAPLFAFIDSWRMVRFVGAMVLQAILILSYWCLTRQARLGRRAFFLGAALLLLPTSVAYGRVVLYECFYVPHIAIGFFLVALYLSIIRRKKERGTVRTPMGMATIFLLLSLAFVSGLGGIRQGMVTFAPLLATAFLLIFQDGRRAKEIRGRALWRDKATLFYALLALAAFVAGYVGNIRMLAKWYMFRDYSGASLGLLTKPTRYKDIILGYLHQFGFRLPIAPMSVMGVLSLGGLFIAAYIAMRGAWFALRPDKASLDDPYGKRFVQNFFFPSLVILVGSFVFVEQPSHYYLRFYIPTTVWVIPFLVSFEPIRPKKPRIAAAQKCLVAVCIVVLTLNGLYNTLFFFDPVKYPQKYEGLTYKDPNLVHHLEGAVAFIEENGYILGYSTFWPCNTVTEMTNGGTKMIDLSMTTDPAAMCYYDWLTFKSYRAMKDVGKPFILLNPDEEKTYLQLPISAQSGKVYSDDYYAIYEFSDAAAISEYLSDSGMAEAEGNSP